MCSGDTPDAEEPQSEAGKEVLCPCQFLRRTTHWSRRPIASACAVTTHFISSHTWSGNRGNVPEVSRLT